MRGARSRRKLINPRIMVKAVLDRRGMEALQLEIRREARRLGILVRDVRVRYPGG